MFRGLRYMLDATVNAGNLRVTDALGRTHAFGDGTGPLVSARLADRKLEFDLACDPPLKLGEAYMDGRFRMESGRIYDFLELCVSQVDSDRLWSWVNLPYHLRRLTRFFQYCNPVSRARRNVARHYDIDGAIYSLFLDSDWQYSCGYFEHDGQSLEGAQLAKKRHLAAKLRLQDGQNVLDIGSGWGGLGLYLARAAHVNITGITLSEEQLKVSRSRAQKLGLARSLDFQLRDYRQMTGRFDRIVSVGMFEHVGLPHYKVFFRKMRELLTDDGVGVLHSIGRFDGPAATDPFIARYIFPGGYIPAMSEVLPAIERSGLLVADVEILRLHYAETLRHWRHRFVANWDRAAAILGERFCRMWEFYLAAAEIGFRYQKLMVFQIQFAKEQHALPLTRDYMIDEERRLRKRDHTIAEVPRLVGE